MYLHFEDWSEAPSVAERLDTLGLPHEGTVIKVFSSPEDPRVALGKSALTVVEVNGGEFDPREKYGYKRRRTYSGDEFEEDLLTFGVTDGAADVVRSLFRFSHEQGFCQSAMDLRKKHQVWVIKHPFQSIDGLDAARDNPKRERAIHLDIFLPGSLKVLRDTVDYEDNDKVLSWSEGVQRIKSAS